MNRRGYHPRGKESIAQLEESVGAALEATVERVSEDVQGVEGCERFHDDAFCSRWSPSATTDARYRPMQLKHKLRDGRL